ncbi:ATP-binding protein [Kitasatospora sp. NPDC059571]|uniref:sensor histidine kinase n=1 Tax=Kitasatospora sp. NPDC059571 TaxID=3346871 RepID=UPI0036A16D1F
MTGPAEQPAGFSAVPRGDRCGAPGRGAVTVRGGAQVSEVGLNRVRPPLATALDEALDVAGERLGDHGVTVTRGALPTVSTDPDRLQDVLVNLLVNAAEYAREDGPRAVFIGVECRDGADGAPQEVVVVRDNGIGVPAELSDEVFGHFRRLHRQYEKGGGSGAGLAIVRRTVERHGGRIWLQTPPEGGTEVCFTLPEHCPRPPRAARHTAVGDAQPTAVRPRHPEASA